MGQAALPYFTSNGGYRDRRRRPNRYLLRLQQLGPGNLEMTGAALPGLAERRRIAIVPAFNEEGSVATVIDEIHSFDPGFEIVVIDDGSSDRTSETSGRLRRYGVAHLELTGLASATARPHSVSSPGPGTPPLCRDRAPFDEDGLFSARPTDFLRLLFRQRSIFAYLARPFA